MTRRNIYIHVKTDDVKTEGKKVCRKSVCSFVFNDAKTKSLDLKIVHEK